MPANQSTGADSVRVDERIESIGEKAGYDTYRLSAVVQGAAFALLSLTGFEAPGTVVAGGFFALTMVSYVAFYQWYKRRM